MRGFVKVLVGVLLVVIVVVVFLYVVTLP